MQLSKTELLKSGITVKEPQMAQTVSVVDSKIVSTKILPDTFKNKSVNIHGEIPANKSVLFAEVKKNPVAVNPSDKTKPNTENEPDTAKNIMNGVSVAADGVSTIFEKFDFIKVSNIDALNIFHWGVLDGIDLNFLDGFDAMGVQSLKFISTGLRIGVNYKDLRHDLKNNDPRNSAWDILGLAKGAFGFVVGGVKTAEASSVFGVNIGLNSAQTVTYLGAKSKSVTNMVNKMAIPLSIANTDLILWDFMDDNKKVSNKEKELVKSTNEPLENSKKTEDKEKKIKQEIGVLKTNTKIMGVSLGLSSISTIALIGSVIYPPSAKIAVPVSIAGNAIASVARSLSDDTVRTKIVTTYSFAKNKYTEINNDVNRFLVR